MRTRIYIRRSDADQSAFSPDAQRRECEAYAARNGHTVVGVYTDDDLSGKLERRPELQRLLSEAKADRGSLVIVHKFDRLARDTELLLRVVYKTLQPAGVRVESATEGIDIYTPLGKMMLTIGGGVATHYVDNLATEVRKGLKEKYQRGGHLGLVPFGYRRAWRFDVSGARIPGSDTLEPSEHAPVVLHIYRTYATGQHSAASLAAVLNAEGYLMHSRDGAGSFTMDAVRHILQSPTYAGLVSYKGETRAGTHPAIVPPELWARVQEMRQMRSERASRKPTVRTAALFSDLARCAICGAKMHYHPNSGGRYYRCAALRQRGKDACTAKLVPADVVGERIGALLRSFVLPDDLVREALEHLETMRDVPQPAAPPVDYEERLRRLNKVYLAGGIDDAEYDAERRRLETLIAEAPPIVPPQRPDFAAAAAVLRTAGDLYTHNAADRRATLTTLFDALWLEHHEVTAITPKPAYIVLIGAIRAGLCVGDATPIGLDTATPIPPIWTAHRVALQ